VYSIAAFGHVAGGFLLGWGLFVERLLRRRPTP